MNLIVFIPATISWRPAPPFSNLQTSHPISVPITYSCNFFLVLDPALSFSRSKMDSLPSRLGRLEISASAKTNNFKTSLHTNFRNPPKHPINKTEFTGGDQSASIFIYRVPYDIRLMIYQQLILPISPILHINYFAHRKCQPCIVDRVHNIRNAGNMWITPDPWGVRHHFCFLLASLPEEEEDPNLRTLLNLARSSHQL